MAVEIIDGRGYTLRHVHPTATYPSEGGTATLLGVTYGFTWLRQPGIPTGSGFVEGSYTRRLGDSGEFTVTFPNAVGVLGPWRDRFSCDGATEFLEIYRDDELEFVGCIQRVEVDRGSVTVSGPDGWGLLRRAYERDRVWTAAPQAVVEAYTRVPVAVMADDFTGGTLDAAWNLSSNTTVTVSDGTATLKSSTASNTPKMSRTVGTPSDTWRFTCVLKTDNLDTLEEILVGVEDGSSNGHVIAIAEKYWAMRLYPASTRINLIPAVVDRKAFITVQIERRGQWTLTYINGHLIGVDSYPSAASGALDAFIQINATSSTSDRVIIDSAVFTEQQAFLARGSDLGDYVLPGDQPTGGLRGRYFNAADLQGLTSTVRNSRIIAPNREPYAERLDATMNTAAGLSIPVQPGNSGDYFAVRWFGSVYLRGDLGDYTIETTSIDDGIRVWIGKTGWGDQLIDDWTTGSGTNTATWDASDHGSQAGWYPIIVEYFEDTGSAAFRLQFTPPGSYTDPGGTSITSGSKITIPSTSLSPLGCFDNRVQGTSHFDLIQQAATSFGYDLTLEPKTLESGEFPGRLVPRVRVGSDTDVILEPEDTDAVEPALNPGVTFDATDQAVTLIGSGAGIADGRGSQTMGEVTDLDNVTDGLFALEAWVDAGDIGFTDLLAARLNAELALRATPWEEVRATPRAQTRIADTWPLSDSVAAMRWEPGDGLQIRVPDISVEDTTPRQIIQVSRVFTPDGVTGTQVAFRQRPRSAAAAVHGHLRGALTQGRSYQRQKITLQSEMVNVAGATITPTSTTDYTAIALLPDDQVIRAYARIVVNSASMAVGLEINGTDRTSALGGSWSTIPADVDITGYATQASTTDPRLYIRAINKGASDTIINFQVFIEVLR